MGSFSAAAKIGALWHCLAQVDEVHLRSRAAIALLQILGKLPLLLELRIALLWDAGGIPALFKSAELELFVDIRPPYIEWRDCAGRC